MKQHMTPSKATLSCLRLTKYPILLEKSLDQARVNAQAKSAYGIVMDVQTGGILAMATKGDFDPNEPHTIADKGNGGEARKDYEPGGK